MQNFFSAGALNTPSANVIGALGNYASGLTGGPTMTPPHIIAGQTPPSLPPTQVGMVPGVPGSMGTNPANGAGGPVMTPGGGGDHPPAGTPGGGPIPVDIPPPHPVMGGGFGGQLGGQGGHFPFANFNDFLGALQQWRSGMQDWRGQRPDRTDGEAPQDWRSAMQDWRGQRPDRQDYWTGGLMRGSFGPSYVASNATTGTGASPPAQVGGANGNTGIVPPAMLPPVAAPPVPTPATAPTAAVDPQAFYNQFGYYPGG